MTTELLIVSPTPQNLERGALWFKENHSSIKKSLGTHLWWSQNAFVIEKDLLVKPSVFVRRLLDFGYERAGRVTGKGLFSVQGGIIRLWPINTGKPFTIEFLGNTVELIREDSEAEEKIKIPLLRPENLEKLPPGSFVVHQDHGIGIFQGISQNPGEGHWFVIEYAAPRPGAQPDRLLVPRDQKDRLTPYMGFESPKIHRLGGSLWITTKRKVREDTEKLAKELLALYAEREKAERPPYPPDQLEETLRESFVYTETDDQIKAEEELLKDLEKIRPMDRVLCGDVGFGKTEIALRAALRVVLNGKQVAVLAPTTLLASQHERLFNTRLANLPVSVAMLSRLNSPHEDKIVLERLKKGTIDCVVGTHRLLSRDVEFKNLGLVIVDEEQRFGVKQKEHFKNLRSSIDMLSLSATPIPRTLSLALAKLRDLSVILTPPPERIPIVTSVLPHSKKVMSEAINFELERNGQIYFLHNRIETIEGVRQKLLKLKLIKKPRIAIIHGRMPELAMVRMMRAFEAREYDILLATTIIENGIDISSANTLIVDDATRLGLAEAHQLRGRIGRSNQQAFAYFFYPHTNRALNSTRAKRSIRYGVGVNRPHHLTEKAGERLAALQEYADLGAGYQIALRDLEIRGAGNILGKEQSGAINKVGLNLYCQMLAEAVENMKSSAGAEL